MVWPSHGLCDHMAFVKYQDCSDDNYDPPTADEVEHYARIVGAAL